MDARAVLFDLFGTLVPRWSPSASEASRATMAAILEVDAEVFAQAWSATFLERDTGRHASIEESLALLCEAHGWRVSRARLQAAADARHAAMRVALAPRAGALEVLQDLKAHGVRLGLVSNCGPGVSHVWPESAFAPAFDVAALSAEVGALKPAAEIYLHATRHLGVDPEQCLYIGDGMDMELAGAGALGMQVVLYTVPDGEAGDPRGAEAVGWTGARISAFEELRDWVTVAFKGRSSGRAGD